jgi:AcrR family transcriptional regulator
MKDQKEVIADEFQKRFNHFGFKKTSVDDVARALQISKKTIYQHFSSKEEIFYYIVSRVARQYRAKMERELAAYPTHREKLEHLIRMIFAESRQWLKTNDAFEFKYKVEIAELAFQDTYEELIVDLVQGGIDAGEFSAPQADLAGRFIRGIIAESMKLLQSDPDLAIEEDAIAAILKLLE